MANSFEEMCQKLQKQVDTSLKKDVAPTIKLVQSVIIDKVVYKAYEPVMYKRRKEDGGLSDIRNMIDDVSNHILSIENKTKPNLDPDFLEQSEDGVDANYIKSDLPDDLGVLIEGGHITSGYSYQYVVDGAGYLNPRPFVQKTIEELKTNKQHVGALKHGLENLGYEVRLS